MASPSCALFRFPEEHNDAFLREYGARSVRVVRLATCVCMAIVLLLEFWPHELKTKTGQLIFLGMNMPGLAVWFALTFWRRARRYLHVISTAAGFIVLGVGSIAFLYYIPGIAYRHEPQAAVLITLLFYAGLRLPLLWAASTAWAYAAMFVWSGFYLVDYPAQALRLAIPYLISANLLGMYIAYVLERSMRMDYLNRIEIAEQRQRAEKLLLNVLPAPIAERLKAGETPIADGFKDATVLFADLVGYTSLAGRTGPAELIALLNDVFSRFDRLAERRGAEKIKTIGDAYMAVGGVPAPLPGHADAMAALALDMLKEIEAVNRERGTALSLRVGLHSGPVVAGVIGNAKFSYDLWGDAVNVASRMESHGVAGAVHLTEDVAARLTRLKPEARGAVEVKGKGRMNTYLLRPS